MDKFNMEKSDEKLKIPDNLEWYVEEKRTALKNFKSKGIFGFLVPLGCVVTCGILVNGIYTIYKKNSRKQQLLMRYRILAQGITLALTTVGMFNYKRTDN